MTDTRDPSRIDPAATDVSPPVLGSFSNGADGDREEFTFVPLDVVGDDLLTTWITADGRSVVHLDDWQ